MMNTPQWAGACRDSMQYKTTYSPTFTKINSFNFQ